MRDKRLPAIPWGLVAACIVESGFLLHRQRIEFGAHHDGRTVAVLVDRDQSGLADLFGDLEAECAHLGGELGGGLLLLKGEFGMRMEILVERIQLWIVGLERFLDCGLERGNVHLGMRWPEREGA